MPKTALGALATILAVAPAPAQTMDRTDLAHVDAHVAATPPKAEASIRTLADYLAAAGPTDLERARAVYQWVSSNIAYDVAGFRSGEYGDLSPDGVLRRRTGVCSGYAGLAEALGRAMGLEIQVISGWSKGYGYRAGAAIEAGANHAWNAVRVDGQWRLMDPTWGAGYIDDEMQFVRRPQDHYFLTDPEAFILDHFPEDPRWQLLDPPVTRTEYGEMVFLRPHFFANRLTVRSHRRGRILTDSRLTVEIGTPGDVLLLARVLNADTEEQLEGRTFVQLADTTILIDAVFPHRGPYLLRMFVKPRSAEGSYDWAGDYRVEALAGDPDGDFPLAYLAFSEYGALLHSPIQGTLTAGETYPFRLRAPDALDVAVVVDGEWHHLTSENDHVFSGDVTVAAGDVPVFARFQEGGSYLALVKYTAR